MLENLIKDQKEEFEMKVLFIIIALENVFLMINYRIREQQFYDNAKNEFLPHRINSLTTTLLKANN